ncbi:hypothetical protein P7C70_g7698, partial [Phenoliferia sp. Uapishka_3]
MPAAPVDDFPLYTKKPSAKLTLQLYYLRREGPSKWEYHYTMLPSALPLHKGVTTLDGSGKADFVRVRNQAIAKKDLVCIAKMEAWLVACVQPGGIDTREGWEKQLEMEFEVDLKECRKAAEKDLEYLALKKMVARSVLEPLQVEWPQQTSRETIMLDERDFDGLRADPLVDSRALCSNAQFISAYNTCLTDNCNATAVTTGQQLGAQICSAALASASGRSIAKVNVRPLLTLALCSDSGASSTLMSASSSASSSFASVSSSASSINSAASASASSVAESVRSSASSVAMSASSAAASIVSSAKSFEASASGAALSSAIEAAASAESSASSVISSVKSEASQAVASAESVVTQAAGTATSVIGSAISKGTAGIASATGAAGSAAASKGAATSLGPVAGGLLATLLAFIIAA